MKILLFQKGFNYSQDGTGNRLVIHLSGCNLHCPWCSNPEGMEGKNGTYIDVDELFEEIKSCKRLFFDGGGVTFTGGECTLQKEALYYLLKKCKKEKINTAIETNGTMPYEKKFFDLVDQIICDFKHYNKEKLTKTVGDVKDYQQNVKDYIKSKKPVIIRTVLINNFSASKTDAEKFCEFFKDLNTENTRFEFLLYHEYGKDKWAKCGKTYNIKDAFVSDGTREYFEKIFNDNGLKTVRS